MIDPSLEIKRLAEKNGLYIAIGKQGAGKTALITSITVNEFFQEQRLILSNYTLYELPYLKINLQSIIDLITSNILIEVLVLNDEEYFIAREFEKIKGYYPNSNDDYLNNTIILIDEIHIYFDSYDFLKKNNRIISGFVSQLRKRNTLLLATTQYLLTLTNRVRKQAKYVFDIRPKGILFDCDISTIDGYYTEKVKSVMLDLKPYFHHYDTYEIIRP